MSESVVISLEDNVHRFSLVCAPEIRTSEDLDTDAVKYIFIKTLVGYPNQLGSIGSPCTGDNVFRFILIDNEVCIIGES